jgi:hypothetical protein
MFTIYNAMTSISELIHLIKSFVVLSCYSHAHTFFMKAFWLWKINLFSSGASLLVNNLEMSLANECIGLIGQKHVIFFG